MENVSENENENENEFENENETENEEVVMDAEPIELERSFSAIPKTEKPKPQRVSGKILKADLKRDIALMGEKLKIELPQGWRYWRKTQLVDLARSLANGAVEAAQAEQLNTTLGVVGGGVEEVAQGVGGLSEKVVVDTLFKFGTLSMDVLSKMTQSRYLHEYTNGYHLHRWGGRIRDDEQMTGQFKEAIREINKEIDLAPYVTAWNRLYLLLAFSAMNAIRGPHPSKIEQI